MKTPSRKELEKNLPKHVLLVLNKCLLLYTSLAKLELELFRIAGVLLDNRISNLTIFNADGYFNRYLSLKYKDCNNKRLDFKALTELCSVENSYLAEDLDEFYTTDHTLIYYINKVNNDLFISTQNNTNYKTQKALTLVLIDNTHSHAKLLKLTPKPKSTNLNPTWVREKSKKGKIILEYQVPDESSITHPDIQKALCTFNDVTVSLPDLLISIRLTLFDLITFIFNYIYTLILNKLNTLLKPIFSKLRIKNIKFDKELLKSASVIRLGDMFTGGMTVVHAFGPSGVQPWFLSEAEIYEVFGFKTMHIVNCINQFANTIRRCGK
ncbi:hypothetical protein TpMuguga_02g00687 [Theileria parva strain Muguga]|uniref:Uncharacterized protein n=1 Tax=Theileria parva TaxID=5875 RepID=Q4N4F3_THEPA|nr:uncharacterized protein TpMuguga_02g00687 [Theileria parva strain Muguga]EAN32970.1 hypothetical protein TpMuguga_02g00687 [Theileria parva strain Muguga]|eukprot:XP_765253.1 hypothetical protein [Theileria parva strain Muguga]